MVDFSTRSGSLKSQGFSTKKDVDCPFHEIGPCSVEIWKWMSGWNKCPLAQSFNVMGKIDCDMGNLVIWIRGRDLFDANGQNMCLFERKY